MEHKIGEIITFPDGRKAEVVEADRRIGCTECVWIGTCPTCLPRERSDGKNIIYKEIKEE